MANPRLFAIYATSDASLNQLQQKVFSSHGKTKRKPAGDTIPVEQENEAHPSPTKRVGTSPSDVQQARHVLAPASTIENRAAHTFVDAIHQTRTSKPVRTQSLSNIKAMCQNHTSSIVASPSLSGAVPSEPIATDDPQVHGHAPSPEKLKVIKGKQPDRRRKHKHEAHQCHDPAQQLLAFLMHNWQMQMALHNSSAEDTATAPPPQVASGEPEQPASEPRRTRSRSDSSTHYPGVTYASPFEGMLVQRSPWPAAAAVMQEVVECACSICARALARRLESARPPPATPLVLSLAPPEEPPALEQASISMTGGGAAAAAAPHDSNSNSSEQHVKTLPQAAPPLSPRHQFFPHIEETLPKAASAEAGPSKPSPARLPSPTSAQDLISMLFAASMSGLVSTVD